NDTARANFLTSMTGLVETYSLDGLDIDWEYPGSTKGNKCNDVDAENDTPNFLLFLQDLRKELTDEKLITMAVRVEPFDVNGAPSDVTEFAKVVDYAHLMQYDINGGWNTTTGPNAPLEFEPGQGAAFSFASAIEAWTSKGWPANQLTAGIPFYGRATTATEDMTQEPVTQYKSQSTTVPPGDEEDIPWEDVCAGNGLVNSGFWQWKYLRSPEVLPTANTTASPWVRNWDDVTKTPWLYNTENKTFISYDDPESIQYKVDYAASKGLAGLMVWAMYMDTPDAELLTVLQSFSSDGSSSSSSSSNDEKIPIPSEDKKPSSSSKSSSSSSSSTTSSKKAKETEPAEKDLLVAKNSDLGDECATEGEYKCVSSDEPGPGYLFCVHGSWLELSCASGTVCDTSAGMMVCNWATTEIALDDE
ncbi:hypothetical protein LPJ57_006828, partial [Coemansia sp. RSA 486]